MPPWLLRCCCWGCGGFFQGPAVQKRGFSSSSSFFSCHSCVSRCMAGGGGENRRYCMIRSLGRDSSSSRNTTTPPAAYWACRACRVCDAGSGQWCQQRIYFPSRYETSVTPNECDANASRRMRAPFFRARYYAARKNYGVRQVNNLPGPNRTSRVRSSYL